MALLGEVEESIGIAEGVLRTADAVGVADAGRKMDKPLVPALLREDAILDGKDGRGEEDRGLPKLVIKEKGLWATGGDIAGLDG
jgi:hypothetical protein